MGVERLRPVVAVVLKLEASVVAVLASVSYRKRGSEALCLRWYGVSKLRVATGAFSEGRLDPFSPAPTSKSALAAAAVVVVPLAWALMFALHEDDEG